MARSKENDFSPQTKRKLQDRAGNRCSLCSHPTSGPSAESGSAVSNTGVAAHIHGAATGPGSRRHLSDMPPAECSDIANGIWLCACCAVLIDRDDQTYTADDLRERKRLHEERAKAAHERKIPLTSDANGHRGDDLVLFTYWKEQIDLPSLEWHTFTRHQRLDGVVLISESFIERVLCFVDNAKHFLSSRYPSRDLSLAAGEFIKTAEDFLSLLYEAEPNPHRTRYGQLFFNHHIEGDFFYLVDTEKESVANLSIQDQIEYELNVVKAVLYTMAMAANGIVRAAHDLRLCGIEVGYLFLRQPIPPTLTEYQTYLGLERTRKFILHQVQAAKE